MSSPPDMRARRLPLLSCLVLVALAGAPPSHAQAVRPDADPRLEALVAGISEQRLRRTVDTLAAFGTRNTLSTTTSPTRGIGAAREWIVGELKAASPRLQVSYDLHQVAQQGRITRDAELRNILAVLPGRSPRRIYVTAHYDTVSLGATGQVGLNAARATTPAAPADALAAPGQDHDQPAPGANDNGSGTALTMELARVIASSGLEFDATLVFALWAGEEQGLVGARAHVQALAAARAPVEADFNSDIVGGSTGGDGAVDAESVRVYAEGPEDSMSRSLARFVHRVGTLYVPSHRIRLIARHDRFGRGSDHSAYNQHGYAAIVFRESNENFAKQHSPSDTPEGVDAAYLARNTRVNVAAVAALALAPAAPVVTDDRGGVRVTRQPSGYDATLQWSPSAGAVAYRVYWRDGWATDWQYSRLVG
ncbi:MAG TPA: M20/M25/M40 family metallo-hydrolase, partial [Gaiellales bacterium]|nr:M20/M25/M40 family metallo-hydrolase [Gaiellales bacterium]